jgi:hypothetical protein
MELLKDNSHKMYNTNQTNCYGSKTFVLRNHGKKKAETSETRFLRMVLGVIVTHKMRSKVSENV